MTGRFPRRSMLYSPADQPHLLENAFDTAADTLIFDFEDSVGPEHKPQARENVRALASEISDADREITVRINDLRTEFWAEDLAAAVDAGVDSIRLPAVESVWEVRTAVETVGQLSPDASIEFGVGLETPRGLFAGREIARYARSTPTVTYLSYGNADYTNALGAPTPTEAILEQLRFFSASFAAIGRVAPIATAYLDIHDSGGLREAAERNRSYGFIGMSAIHPGQVELLNDVFTPEEDAVERARHMVERFDESDSDAIMVDGEFLDTPVVDRYRKLVERYEMIRNFSN